MKAATQSTPRAPHRTTVKKRGVCAPVSFPVKFSSEASAVADGLAIQHRLKAEPVYACTGTGYRAPNGVAEIAIAKRQTKSRHNP